MPRIDPLQLLKCLSVLLTPEGGILSREEVPRLVNLMTKFSKKLVSKCVYVLILKNTQTELVDMFMAEGGWTLIQTWLQDAVQTSNWDLVREILGLLLVTPVDVERLKLNILPKLIKSLSRRDELEGVAHLSTKLVQQWLTIVKGSSNAALQAQTIAKEKIQNDDSAPAIVAATTDTRPSSPTPVKDVETTPHIRPEDVHNAIETVQEEAETISANTFYKTSGKDGKLVIRKLTGDPETTEEVPEVALVVDEKEEKKEKEEKSKSKSRSKDKDKHSRSRDKDSKKSSSSSKSSSSKSKSSSRDKDRKDRDRDKDRQKDKHRSNGSIKSSSNSSSSKKDKEKEKKDSKSTEKQSDKDKDTLAKLKPPTIDKLGRIPKKPSETPEDKSKEIKKKSFSVGIKKDTGEERPKTVKVFNSKMRSTGLEEEVKPAPPRSSKKPSPSIQLPTIPMKRPSPPKEIARDPLVPPEKKLKMDKIDLPERPGAIKLIPPKPKPPVLQESDLFMDALTAATTKKEPKKRKRRLSVSKETPSSPSSSPKNDAAQTPTSPTQSGAQSTSLGLKSIAPINFYQDTLSEVTEENKENADENVEEGSNNESNNGNGTPSSPTEKRPSTPTDDNLGEGVVEVKKMKFDGRLKGVLLHAKKKGPKRSISWKNDDDLVEIKYFELDETERVNVTKTFGDMAKMEMTSEREALQLSRKLGGEDLMESQINWRLPFLLDLDEPLAPPGHKSLEKDIQFAREKSVLQALYFDKRRIPDSPEEPIPENHQMSDPVQIPLEDPDSQEIDLRSTPWPEPKGQAPPPEPQAPPQIFPPNLQGSFSPAFNNIPPPFQNMPPRFPAPGGMGGPGGPNIPGMGGPPGPPGNFGHPPNMMLPPPNEMMNMNPNMFPPGPGPDFGHGPGPEFPMYNNPNPPNNMNMYPQNFNHRPRGGFRRNAGNNGNWVRMTGGNNWKRGGGGGHRGGRLCKNVQNHGFCRNRDNCPFVHP